MAIKIIVDSTCDLDLSMEKKLDIDILPLMLHFGDEEFRDGIDISKKEFYQRMRTASKSPTTSQVTPQSFETLFEQYSKEGHDILVLTLGEQLSGTLQSANIAKSSFDYDRIFLVDSETTTMGLGFILNEAVSMRDQGLDIESIVKNLNKIKKKIVIYAMIDNLEYLVKGGRLSSVGATVGTVLKLKPIIQIKHGKVSVVHKARGKRKAYNWMFKQAKEDKINLDKSVYYGHSDCEEDFDVFTDLADTKLKPLTTMPFEIGVVVGAHAGPGCIGIGFTTH